MKAYAVSKQTSLSELVEGYFKHLMRPAAMLHKADYFISRDKALVKEDIPVLPVYTPEEFVAATHFIFT